MTGAANNDGLQDGRSTAPGIRCTDIVSLRRATFDAAVELLDLVSQLHVCEPDQNMKYNNECDACHATRIVAEMREQANNQAH